MLLEHFRLTVWFKFNFIKLQSYTCGGMSDVTQSVDTYTHTHTHTHIALHVKETML